MIIEDDKSLKVYRESAEIFGNNDFLFVVLDIKDDSFDAQIMEFIYRDGVYESTQRVYSEEGKSPTITASNKEQLIETKPKRVGTAVDIKGHDSLKRVYSEDGKSPTLTTCQGGHREPKVMVRALTEQRTEESKRIRKEHRQRTGKDYPRVNDIPEMSADRLNPQWFLLL